MNLPKAYIHNHFDDFLNGREVEARITPGKDFTLTPGTRVMAYKDSVAAHTNMAVPKDRQAGYIGIEGTIVSAEPNNDAKAQQRIIIRKS